MKKFVQINSTVNVYVVKGYDYVDGTNYASDAPNKLNITPLWTQSEIMIKKGMHWYPAEIQNYPSVKTLVSSGTIMIGQESDTADEEGQKLYDKLKISESSVNKVKETMNNTRKRVSQAKKNAEEVAE